MTEAFGHHGNSKPNGPDDHLYSVNEAAEYLRLSRSTFYELVKIHNPNVYRVGRRTHYQKSVLDELILKHIGTHHFFTLVREIGGKYEHSKHKVEAEQALDSSLAGGWKTPLAVI